MRKNIKIYVLAMLMIFILATAVYAANKKDSVLVTVPSENMWSYQKDKTVFPLIVENKGNKTLTSVKVTFTKIGQKEDGCIFKSNMSIKPGKSATVKVELPMVVPVGASINGNLGILVD